MSAQPSVKRTPRASAARQTPPKLSYRIAEFSQATGICRSSLYEEIAAGRLRTVKFGRSTLVMADDATAFLASLRGAP